MHCVPINWFKYGREKNDWENLKDNAYWTIRRHIEQLWLYDSERKAKQNKNTNRTTNRLKHTTSEITWLYFSFGFELIDGMHPPFNLIKDLTKWSE